MRATDRGTPPLHTDTIVIVSVGAVDGNDPPIFDKDSYQIGVKEHTPPDSFVIQVIHPSIRNYEPILNQFSQIQPILVKINPNSIKFRMKFAFWNQFLPVFVDYSIQNSSDEPI